MNDMKVIERSKKDAHQTFKIHLAVTNIRAQNVIVSTNSTKYKFDRIVAKENKTEQFFFLSRSLSLSLSLCCCY